MSAASKPVVLMPLQPPNERGGRGAVAGRTGMAVGMATAFVTGAVLMGQELVAFRLYAPYFGYSIYVWGSLISVMMAALAFGYALGGWVADRSQSDRPLYWAILGSAIYQAGILFTVQPVLRFFAGLGESSGTALASLVIFAAPMTAMATACPFLIRWLAQPGGVGRVAGRIYALSTAGSIAGILSTSFWLVPRQGTLKTLEGICMLSAAAGVGGLSLRRRAALSGLALIALLLLVPQRSWPAGTIWTGESAYNEVRVERQGQWLWLKLNAYDNVHTIRNERTGFTGHYYDDFALGPILTPAKRLLVLGLGGGGSIASTRMTAPEIEVDAVEIDPKVVEAAQRFFGVNPQDGKLRVHVADARPWLAKNRGSYELVHVDLYAGGPYIPFYLVTREFFEAVRSHMSGDALLMMNLFDVSGKQELLASTMATLKQVFPTVAVLPVGYGNQMLLAFAGERSGDSIRGRLEDFQGDETIQRLARQAASRVGDVHVPRGTPVFTDDLAPVEEITRRMMNGD